MLKLKIESSSGRLYKVNNYNYFMNSLYTMCSYENTCIHGATKYVPRKKTDFIGKWSKSAEYFFPCVEEGWKIYEAFGHFNVGWFYK